MASERRVEERATEPRSTHFKLYEYSLRVFFFVGIVTVSIITSAVLYWIFYELYMPAHEIRIPVYLQYPNENLSSGTKGGTGRRNAGANAIVDLSMGSKSILSNNVEYTFNLDLNIPSSQHNMEIGNFMVSIALCDEKDTPVLYSSRPALATYKTNLATWANSMMRMPLLLFGLAKENEVLSVSMFERVKNSQNKIVKGMIEIGNSNLNVYNTELVIHANFGGIRYFMYYWRVPTATFFIVLSLLLQVGFALFSWSLLEKYIHNNAQVVDSVTQNMAVFRSKRGSSHSSMGSISNGYGGNSGNEIHSRRSTDTSRDSSITGANIKNDSRGVVGYLRDNASSNIHALNLRISGLMSNIRGFNPVRSASPDTESTKRGDLFLKGRSGGRRSSEDIDDLLLSSNSSDAYTSDCMHGKGDSYKFIRSSSATSDGASKGFLNRTEKHEGKAETAKTVYSKFKTPTKQSIARKAKSTMKQPEKFDLRGGGSIPQFDPSGHIKSSSSESMSSKSGNNHAVDTLSEASGYCFVEENDQAHPETKDQQVKNPAQTQTQTHTQPQDYPQSQPQSQSQSQSQAKAKAKANTKTSSKQGPGSTLGNLKSTEAFKELVGSLPNLNVGLSEISVPKSQSNTHTSPTKVVASPSTNSNDSNKKSSLTSSTLEKKPPVIDDGDKDIDTEEFGVVPEASS